jgi:hypothetical protein
LCCLHRRATEVWAAIPWRGAMQVSRTSGTSMRFLHCQVPPSDGPACHAAARRGCEAQRLGCRRSLTASLKAPRHLRSALGWAGSALGLRLSSRTGPPAFES